jgi:hypothetical protein
VSAADCPAVEVLPRFELLLRGLPDERHRVEVEGTLVAISRCWCSLRPAYLNVHAFDWDDVLNPPHRMLIALGEKAGRRYALAIDLFAIRAPGEETPSDRLEAAQLLWLAWSSRPLPPGLRLV